MPFKALLQIPVTVVLFLGYRISHTMAFYLPHILLYCLTIALYNVTNQQSNHVLTSIKVLTKCTEWSSLLAQKAAASWCGCILLIFYLYFIYLDTTRFLLIFSSRWRFVLKPWEYWSHASIVHALPYI